MKKTHLMIAKSTPYRKYILYEMREKRHQYLLDSYNVPIDRYPVPK